MGGFDGEGAEEEGGWGRARARGRGEGGVISLVVSLGGGSARCLRRFHDDGDDDDDDSVLTIRMYGQGSAQRLGMGVLASSN